MAQTKSQIQEALNSANSHPRHRFGQNFMIDQNLVRLVAAAGEIHSGDVVIEVGPGTGTLTEELLASAAKKIIALEIDRDLANILRQRWESDGRFHLIEGDALAGKHGLNPDLLAVLNESNTSGAPTKLVANLPYNIASPLVIDLLQAGVATLVFTVQKEVADRLRAPANDDAYGPLSVMAQLLSDVEVLRTLPQHAFWPAPKIRSALVRMVRHDQLGRIAPAFGRFVHQIFSARRKTLRNALLRADIQPDAPLSQLQFDGSRRPEEFAPLELLALFRAAGGAEQKDRSAESGPNNAGE